VTQPWDETTWPAQVSARTSRQSDLFDALVRVFLAEGFSHLTLADIAGRLRCSKTTLYALARSKEQLAVAVVTHFFRGAAERVEEALTSVADPSDRVGAYLRAVAEQLRPATPAFRRDLAADPAAREVYQRNTVIAARRIRELVAEGVAAGSFRDARADFVGQVATLAMVAIQQGEIEAATGLSDADAYDELATLIRDGLTPPWPVATRSDLVP
jgi:AcrR family transcriptional regulator